MDQPRTAAAGTSAASPQRRSHPLRPMTVKMLLGAQRVGDGTLYVDNVEAGQVTVVGRIIAHEANQGTGGSAAKSVTYRISDGSGAILVRHWLDASVPVAEEEIVPVGEYIRACGTVKIWQDKPTLTGVARTIADYNEVIFHFLDTITAHLRVKGGPRDLPSPATSYATQHTATAAVPTATTRLSVEDAIKRAVTNADKAKGATLEEIQQFAQHHGHSASATRTALKALVDGGTLYSTDDVHYIC